MAPPDAVSPVRGLRVALAVLAGLLLAFGGTCGAGPTDLSLLAVSGTSRAAPDDVRGQVPVPATVEVAAAVRRRVLRRARAAIVHRLGRLRRACGTWAVGVVGPRGPPPLRGPPAPVV